MLPWRRNLPGNWPTVIEEIGHIARSLVMSSSCGFFHGCPRQSLVVSSEVTASRSYFCGVPSRKFCCDCGIGTPKIGIAGMPALVGIRRRVTDLRIQQIRLGRMFAQFPEAFGLKLVLQPVQQLVPVEDLKDAGAADSIGHVYPIYVYTRRVDLVNHFRISGPVGVGHAFVAWTVDARRIVVTALRRGRRTRLLTNQPPLANENRFCRIAQIKDIDVLPRVPFIGRAARDHVRDPGVAFPPDMVREV